MEDSKHAVAGGQWPLPDQHAGCRHLGQCRRTGEFPGVAGAHATEDADACCQAGRQAGCASRRAQTGRRGKTNRRGKMIVERLWPNSHLRNYHYLVVCEETGEALAIDPLDSTLMLDSAREHGWEITRILNTHHHNDHTAG